MLGGDWAGGQGGHTNKTVQIATLRGSSGLDFEILSATLINIQETKWQCR